MIRVSLMLLLPCAACADTTTAGPTTECDADAAQKLVGQQGSAALAAEAQRSSGAGIVRWLQPNQIITMEYRADRLNISIDAGGRVDAIRCG
jgi:hypothetical protein